METANIYEVYTICPVGYPVDYPQKRETEREEKYTSRSPEAKPKDDSLQWFSGSDPLSSTENRGTPSYATGVGDVSQ